MAWNCSNQFRRSGQRDDRRRLLFHEDVCRSGKQGRTRRARSAGQDEMSERTWPHYSLEALADQPRVTDLVPHRLSVHFLLFLLGAAAITAIQAAFAWLPETSRVRAFNLTGPGSLAAWFLSATLLAASVVSLLVYSVRRFRTDDYRGDYRIWLWAAMCWAVMSANAAAGLGEAFRDTMVRLTGTALYGDGSLWWAVPYLVVLIALGSRLLVDVWPARLSTGALVVAGGCLVSAVVVQLGWIAIGDGVRNAMVGRGAEMVGCWMLLLGCSLQARYVVLDAGGLLPRPEPKRKKVDDADEEEEDECETDREWVAIDAPHQSPAPVLRRRQTPKSEPVASVAETEVKVGRKLTKQEKKALRQRLQRERLQREQTQRKQWAS